MLISFKVDLPFAGALGSSTPIFRDIKGPMLNAIRSAAVILINQSFKKTTETWSADHSVKFEAHPTTAAGMVGVNITTNPPPSGGKTTHDAATGADIWNWIDGGTRGRTGSERGSVYTITVRPEWKNLTLPSTWSPKTKPKTIASFAGSRGKQEQGPVSVPHYGIEPRYFSATIAEEKREWFQKQMQWELNHLAKQSKYSMSR